MADAQVCKVIAKKINAFQGGVQDLEKVRQELNVNVDAANAWGVTAVMANLVILPLNIVVNALEAPKAKTIAQRAAAWAYSKYGKSGTRTSGDPKEASDLVGQFRDVINAELKKEKLVEYIPGVNIIVGAIQDSIAAWQTVDMVNSGSAELKKLQQSVQSNIAKMKKSLQDLQDIYDRECGASSGPAPSMFLS